MEEFFKNLRALDPRNKTNGVMPQFKVGQKGNGDGSENVEDPKIGIRQDLVPDTDNTIRRYDTPKTRYVDDLEASLAHPVRNIVPASWEKFDLGVAQNADVLNEILDDLSKASGLKDKARIIENGKAKIKNPSTGTDIWFTSVEKLASQISPIEYQIGSPEGDGVGSYSGLRHRRREVDYTVDDDPYATLRTLTNAAKKRYFQQL